MRQEFFFFSEYNIKCHHFIQRKEKLIQKTWHGIEQIKKMQNSVIQILTNKKISNSISVLTTDYCGKY